MSDLHPLPKTEKIYPRKSLVTKDQESLYISSPTNLSLINYNLSLFVNDNINCLINEHFNNQDPIPLSTQIFKSHKTLYKCVLKKLF